MNIKLLAFASASEALGATELDYQLDHEADDLHPAPTVGDLKQALTEQFPNLEQLWQRLAVSINGEIATDVDALIEGAEVALLPPVSGG